MNRVNRMIRMIWIMKDRGIRESFHVLSLAQLEAHFRTVDTSVFITVLMTWVGESFISLSWTNSTVTRNDFFDDSYPCLSDTKTKSNVLLFDSIITVLYIVYFNAVVRILGFDLRARWSVLLVCLNIVSE